MIACVVAVRDSAAGAYSRPFTSPTVALATRSFTSEVNRNAADNLMYTHPEDFELWHLQNFDEESGNFLPVEVRCICRAKDVLVKEPA